MSARNGLESALRATPALNGFFGPLESQLTDAHCSAQADLAYFRDHPWAQTRVRAAFPGEFSRALRRQARGRELLVIVTVIRDPAGEPITRGRGVCFTDGGSA